MPTKSAGFTTSLLEKVLRFEPLTPLTGESDEWNEVGTGIFQNNRCPHVFKNGKDGTAYDINGIIFEDQNGSRWSNNDSKVYITFPYTPTSVIVRQE